ncbi:MAG: hypothetical protein AB1448_07650 [Pseudomonadota bacterium]
MHSAEMSRPIPIVYRDGFSAINLPDHDAGDDLGGVEWALLEFGAEKLQTLGNPLEEMRLYRHGPIDIALTWDGFTADLQVVGEGNLQALFAAMSASPFFEIYQTARQPKVR